MNHAKQNDSAAEAHVGFASEPRYEKPEMEQELRADLEETWQDESPRTALETDTADEVDGHQGTRHRGSKTT